jgi:hypothetical protein
MSFGLRAAIPIDVNDDLLASNFQSIRTDKVLPWRTEALDGTLDPSLETYQVKLVLKCHCILHGIEQGHIFWH